MNCDAKAYEGGEPFIFVSYAHDDAHLVYPIVERLVMDGFRVWYDDGIQAGEDWTETVAARLGESAICIPMLTENYVRSVNCRNELAYSLNKGKTVISIKLTDFELPGSIELQLGNALYLEKYRYGETEFYERLQVSHGILGCRDEAPRITDGQLMAWRTKWADAAPIRRAAGEPDRVKLQAPELSKKTGGASKKGLFLGLAAAAVLVLAVLAVVLLPRLTQKESPAAAEALTADTGAAQSFTLAGPVSDPDSAEVLPSRVYDCSEGLEISDVSCILYDQETKPLLEITVAWKNNTDVAALYAFAGATYPYDSKTVESYRENFYPLSGLPTLKGGTVSRFQKTSTNMFFPDLAYELVMCLDAEGNVIGCIQIELGQAAEIAGQGAGAASSAPAITDRQEMEVLQVESTPGFAVKDIRCDVLGRGKNAWFEITVTWEHNTQVGTVFAFANSNGPYTAAEITENQKNFYRVTNSPFLTGGEIEKVQTAYYDIVPAAGPVWLLLYCFDQDGTAVAYIMLEADYPQEN